MEKYEVLGRLGEGGYGEVFKARVRHDDSSVAMKFIEYDSEMEDVPSEVIREISLLKELKHDNVVRLLDTFDTKDGFYLVLEYMSLDLSAFISGTKAELDPLVIKSFLFQILQGLSYCHSKNVIHRDLKPENLLIDAGGKTIKLADFGLARATEVPLPQYSNDIASRSYRAPEIMFSAPYSSAVDIWSVGCIFAEMAIKEVLFAVMRPLIDMHGDPNEKDWPGITSGSHNLFSNDQIPTFSLDLDLAASVPTLDTQGLDLLSKMLCFDPRGRITAYEALQHPYFNDLQANP